MFLLNGFFVYKNAVKTMPIDQKLQELSSHDDYVEIQNISDSLKTYFVNVEDKRFYKHNGIDLIGIVGSLISNLKEGYYKYGGSTITQQLAKNLYFKDGRKTLTRKVAEMFAAFEFERKYSKDKILEMYLNIIYFGNGYYGINEASQGYFEIFPKDLNEYQSSLLVGIPQAPSVYNLNEKGKSAMKSRYMQVLKILTDNGTITKNQADQFKKLYLAS